MLSQRESHNQIHNIKILKTKRNLYTPLGWCERGDIEKGKVNKFNSQEHSRSMLAGKSAKGPVEIDR